MAGLHITAKNLLRFGRPKGSEYRSRGQSAGAVLLLAATGACAASFVDDLLVYQRCSSKAIEKAAGDERLKRLVGPPIKQEAWYKASIAFAHSGRAVSCSFPVSGSKGTADIRLRAFRPEETGMWKNIFKSGSWELLAVEAYVPVVHGGVQHLQRIDLM